MANHGFTQRAIDLGYVRVENGETVYFADMPNGDYLATGYDVNGKYIKRGYIVNNRVDRQSVWSLWNDFNGRWGLNRIWYLTDEGKKILVYRG